MMKLSETRTLLKETAKQVLPVMDILSVETLKYGDLFGNKSEYLSKTEKAASRTTNLLQERFTRLMRVFNHLYSDEEVLDAFIKMYAFCVGGASEIYGTVNKPTLTSLAATAFKDIQNFLADTYTEIYSTTDIKPEHSGVSIRSKSLFEIPMCELKLIRANDTDTVYLDITTSTNEHFKLTFSDTTSKAINFHTFNEWAMKQSLIGVKFEPLE